MLDIFCLLFGQIKAGDPWLRIDVDPLSKWP